MQNDIKPREERPSIKSPTATENLNTQSAPTNQPDTKPTPNAKGKRFRLKLTRKQQLIAVIVAILLVIAGITTAIILNQRETAPKEIKTAVEPPPEPPKTTEPSHLTGLEVPFDVNKRTVTGIMIENSPEARPQSGLREAGVVYEAVAEGGITRFLALFQDNLPEYVGPVRSVRPYYLDFLGPYNAAIAHVGGSGQALNEIRAEGIRDLDQFANSSAYWRESSRYAPHNMYTNVVKLKELESQKGWAASEYQSLERGETDKPAATPTASVVNVRMSRALYNVSFEYDAANNLYKRNLAGQPHVDAKSGAQITPKVIIVPVIPRSQNGIYSVYAVNGSGKVYVFQNGTVTEGTWEKAGRSGQFRFKTADGQTLKLIPGQTWFTVAAAATDVTVTP